MPTHKEIADSKARNSHVAEPLRGIVNALSPHVAQFNPAIYRRALKRSTQRLAFDRTFYLILCRASDGSVYSPERNWEDMTEAEIVSDIASGQLENVIAVFSFNGAQTDISEDIARAVLGKCVDDNGGISKSAAGFVEEQTGVAA